MTLSVSTVRVEQVSVEKTKNFEVYTVISYRPLDAYNGPINGFSVAGNFFDNVNVGDRVDVYTDERDDLTHITKVVLENGLVTIGMPKTIKRLALYP